MKIYVITCHLGPKIQQHFVCYTRELVITVFIITEFDCITLCGQASGDLKMNHKTHKKICFVVVVIALLEQQQQQQQQYMSKSQSKANYFLMSSDL